MRLETSISVTKETIIKKKVKLSWVEEKHNKNS